MIEELKVLSGQLRSTVQGLLAELDDRNKEIEKLKERITVLESEKEKGMYFYSVSNFINIQAVRHKNRHGVKTCFSIDRI